MSIRPTSAVFSTVSVTQRFGIERLLLDWCQRSVERSGRFGAFGEHGRMVGLSSLHPVKTLRRRHLFEFCACCFRIAAWRWPRGLRCCRKGRPGGLLRCIELELGLQIGHVFGPALLHALHELAVMWPVHAMFHSGR